MANPDFIDFTVQNMPRELHDRAKTMAKEKKRISLRQFVIEAVQEKIVREALNGQARG